MLVCFINVEMVIEKYIKIKLIKYKIVLEEILKKI